jgi:predicted nucleic acid-binding protein
MAPSGTRREGYVNGSHKAADAGVSLCAVAGVLGREVANVLRRLVINGNLTDEQATTALSGFTRLALTRFPADWLRPRMWALRHNLSAYDATYVALAEMTGATSLLTTDSRLANAPGINCPIELL